MEEEDCKKQQQGCNLQGIKKQQQVLGNVGIPRGHDSETG
jgi:hypothetical protein